MDISDIISGTKGLNITDRLCILSFALSMKKEDVLIKKEMRLNQEDVELIKSLIEKRTQGMPLAYITKTKEFYSEEFYVDESVLIPRPETELLVEEAIHIIKGMNGPVRILDVGTGSGVIGITISKHTGHRVICTDISSEALKIASINIKRAGLSDKIGLICMDLIAGIKDRTVYDVIVANLPYISQDEWDFVSEEVKGFEPKTALFGGKDGLEVYRRFIDALQGPLKDNGWFLCEVGGRLQAEAIKDMLVRKGFEVSIKRDYSGIERIVIGQWISLS
ncbi:MAG: peptide chain release factor N(5)-glutamine methyltransferase [Syntrophorhabdaceae bacterium]|nr:peptide chain release factor N(5)-glutamine methyltransferase [Syntrophorhabdaceae bacterium]